ncbi:MAG: cytochrome c oxidase assembly protein [Methylomicrobium sp.]
MLAKPKMPFVFVELAAVSVLAFLAFCYGEIAGLFSRHMIIHIILMTIAAPVLASLLQKSAYSVTPLISIRSLAASTILQMALFFAWHSPPGWAAIGQGNDAIMQATLFFSALWFWLTVFTQASRHLWRTVAALLLTGKLFCLIAVLLTFAPRVLHGAVASGLASADDLADQQLAGLLMISVCPLTYVLAAIVLISRWFHALSDVRDDRMPAVVNSESRS